MPQVIFAVFIICQSVCVMVHLYCQCDEIYGHLGETVFIRLIEVIPAHCEWHHSLGQDFGLYKKKRVSKLSTTIHYSLLLDCECQMTSCSEFLLP